MKLSFPLFTALLLCSATLAQADLRGARANDYPLANAARSEAGYEWRDGTLRRPLWLDTAVLAQISSGDARRDALPAALAGAIPIDSGNALKLWRLPAGLTATAALSRLRPDQRRDFSPVWRDGAGAGAGWRVAASTVIVFLPTTVSSAEAQATLDRLALRGATPLPYRINGFSVQVAGAGLLAVQRANELAGEPGVEAAFPHWLIPGVVQ